MGALACSPWHKSTLYIPTQAIADFGYVNEERIWAGGSPYCAEWVYTSKVKMRNHLRCPKIA
eukprot:1161863-Pelagomonas_calceolata.AAC.9